MIGATLWQPFSSTHRLVPLRGSFTDQRDRLLLELTRFVSDYYLCSWGEAIETALPPDPGPPRGRRVVMAEHSNDLWRDFPKTAIECDDLSLDGLRRRLLLQIDGLRLRRTGQACETGQSAEQVCSACILDG